MCVAVTEELAGVLPASVQTCVQEAKTYRSLKSTMEQVHAGSVVGMVQLNRELIAAASLTEPVVSKEEVTKAVRQLKAEWGRHLDNHAAWTDLTAARAFLEKKHEAAQL